MAANILVTDDRRNALEKITKRTCDIAVHVSAYGVVLLYASRDDVLYVLSGERKGFSDFGMVGGVSVFSADMGERQIIDRLTELFGSVRTDYEIFGDEEDDDGGFFEIGML